MTAVGTFSKLAALCFLFIASLLFPWPAGPLSGGALLASLLLWTLGAMRIDAFGKSISVLIPLSVLLAGWGYRHPAVPFAAHHPGILIISVGCVVLALSVALFVHTRRLIRVTPRLNAQSFGALLVVAFGGSLLLPKAFYAVPCLYAGPPLELVFAGLVWFVATLQMICNLDDMAREIARGAPRYREWQVAMMLFLYMVMVFI